MLLGSDDLYDRGRFQETSRDATGLYSPNHGCTRLPYNYVFV